MGDAGGEPAPACKTSRREYTAVRRLSGNMYVPVPPKVP